MKMHSLLIFFLLVVEPAKASYTSKFWLSPKSQQVQLLNHETKSMVLINLEYYALKMFLYRYEIIKAGNFDPVLSTINEAKDLKKIIPLIDDVEYIGLSGERFGDLDENFVSYSVFGSKPSLNETFKTQKEMDVFLIKRLLSRLFSNNEQMIKAKPISACNEFLAQM